MSVDNPVHQQGWCITYGSAGKRSPFDPELPAFANKPAQKLSLEAHSILLDVCGSSWDDILYTCCDESQLNVLSNNFNRIAPLISSCPACRHSFNQLFCHFTCSPNQSQFINVTSTETFPNGNIAIDELEFYVNPQNSLQFYNSCKNIKIGATNGLAMDLIGGGATNYTSFLKFLGDVKPQLGGSPFQINFKYNIDTDIQDIQDNKNSSLKLLDWDTKDCNDIDPNFACACSDCPLVCPVLDTLPKRDVHFDSKVSHFVLISYFILLISYFSILKIWRINKSKKRGVFLNDEDTENDTNNNDNEIIIEATNTLTSSIISFNSANIHPLNTKKAYIVNRYLEHFFYNLGYICSTYPKIILIITSIIIIIFTSFMSFIQFETNPINLWVSPTSDVFIQKQIFDESFNPFYRTQQLILSNSTGDSILQDYDFIKWWFQKENEMINLQSTLYINDTQYNVTYDDICFKPLEETCILESFTQYFYGDINYLPESNWKEKIQLCAGSPVECLPTFQQPLKPNLIFGRTEDKNEDILQSSSIVVTFLNNNNNDINSKQVQMASSWENMFESYLLNNLTVEANERGINLSFMTEVSLEKELNKSTNTDIRIVVLSYLIMFIYASYSLSMNQLNNNISFVNSTFITPFGKVSGNNLILQFFSKTKFSLGLIGIIIVLFSVFASMGFWSLMGLKSTLIIVEVIPFLILAIGIDNIFLISNELKNIEKLFIMNNLNLNIKIAKTMSNIGPSILLSSLSQVFCFSLGSFVTMPAVKNFSLYITVAVIFNTILQITTFVSILTLEQDRILSGKLDLIPFVKIEPNSVSLPINNNDYHSRSGSNLIQMLNESDDSNSKSMLNDFFQKKFVPFIFRKDIKRLIMIIFLSVFGISLSLIPKLELGLDQRIALPNDSYLINYFNDMYDYLNVGPPVYFIVEDFNVTAIDNQKQLCSKFTKCDSYSMVNIINGEYSRVNESYIAEPVSSWIDDFLLWMNPELNECCRVKVRNDEEFCEPFAPPRMCKACLADKDWDYQMNGFPEGEEFMKYFNEWIESPSYPCALGGKAPYSSSIYEDEDFKSIKRSAFRTLHTALRSQDDFIKAYSNSKRIVKEIKEYHPNLKVFAYSPFYIFFDQYETIGRLTILLLSIGMIVIGVITAIFFGSIRNSMILIINLLFIMINIIGWMVLNNISLNGVSLVNLMICLGLSVEFSIHLIKYFNELNGIAEERAKESVAYIGTITLSGITMTKLIGVCVLSFTRSEIFRVYYFKMWIGLVVIASIHSLVFTPVLMSIIG